MIAFQDNSFDFPVTDQALVYTGTLATIHREVKGKQTVILVTIPCKNCYIVVKIKVEKQEESWMLEMRKISAFPLEFSTIQYVLINSFNLSY